MICVSVFAWFNHCLAKLSHESHLLTCGKHTLSAGARSHTFCGWAECCLLWSSDRDVATSLADKEYSRHLHSIDQSKWLHEGLVWTIWATVEYIVCGIIYSEIAILESLWSFCLQLHFWVLVLEGLNPSLPPHLQPPIGWIKPLPYTFLLTTASPSLNYPQNPAGKK